MESYSGMKGTETGKDKVKKICDILRRETLDPAQLKRRKSSGLRRRRRRDRRVCPQ